MQAVTTIGLDIAKSVFQVHGVEAHGNVLVRRQLKRRHVVAFFEKLPPCLVGPARRRIIGRTNSKSLGPCRRQIQSRKLHV
jgi:transposase